MLLERLILPLVALLAPTAASAGAQTARDAGQVVLLGELSSAGDVPELAAAGGPAVLLSPYPNLVESLATERLLGRAARCFHVRPGDVDRSNGRELAQAVRSAGLIGLWGGDQHDWYDVFWPGGERSRLLAALLEAWRGGAVVAGQGAPVAFLSAASVWDFSFPADPPVRRPASPGHDQGDPVLAWNLGLQPWAAIDTEPREGGSAWDLVDLLVGEGVGLGAYLEADAALVFDPSVPELRARGKGCVWLFDLQGAKRGKRSLLGARFSVLNEGDRWRRRQHEVIPRESAGTPVDEWEAPIVAEDGWVLSRARSDEDRPFSLGPGPLGAPIGRRVFVHNGWRGEGRRARMQLVPDEDSAVYARPDLGAALKRVTLANLRLDLEWDL